MVWVGERCIVEKDVGDSWGRGRRRDLMEEGAQLLARRKSMSNLVSQSRLEIGRLPCLFFRFTHLFLYAQSIVVKSSDW